MSAKSLKYKQTVGVAAAALLYTFLDATLVSGSNVIAGVDYVIVQPESQNIRWRDDGTAPTASVGHLIVANQTYVFTRSQFARLRFIETAASATVNVTAYKNG